MMAAGTALFSASSTAFFMACRSLGSTMMIFSKPTASKIFSMRICRVGSPIRVRSVPGLSWWPVMAVMLLSSTQGTTLHLLYMISSAPVMPLWKKVLSPSTPITFFCRPVSSNALDMPMPALKPAPMQMVVSSAHRGSALPSV